MFNSHDLCSDSLPLFPRSPPSRISLYQSQSNPLISSCRLGGGAHLNRTGDFRCFRQTSTATNQPVVELVVVGDPPALPPAGDPGKLMSLGLVGIVKDFPFERVR